jgi:predicted enzyme related to lactoylglutathione lyase
MIRGLRTAIYPAPDLERGKRFYTAVLGIEPYFDQPFYVGNAASGFELGLVPDGEPGSSGVQVYGAADDAAAEMDRLVAAGAEVHDAVKEVGDGIKVGLARDPFGNLFGIIENPHFKLADVR